MKTKSILFAICAVVFSAFFVGCKGSQTNAINMNRYFSSKVTSSSTNYTLSSFIGESVDSATVKSQTYLKFQGNLSWIYGMYLDCAYFNFYSTRKTDSQFIKITITNLNEEYSETIEITTNKNAGTRVKIDIDKTVLSLSEEVYFTFEIDDPLVAVGSYAWSIYGFSVCGEHK